MCYIGIMITASAIPETERTSLLEALKAAETRLKAGEGVDYHPERFKKRLLEIYRGSMLGDS
jgi:hypothetical protein